MPSEEVWRTVIPPSLCWGKVAFELGLEELLGFGQIWKSVKGMTGKPNNIKRYVSESCREWEENARCACRGPYIPH